MVRVLCAAGVSLVRTATWQAQCSGARANSLVAALSMLTRRKNPPGQHTHVAAIRQNVDLITHMHRLARIRTPCPTAEQDQPREGTRRPLLQRLLRSTWPPRVLVRDGGRRCGRQHGRVRCCAQSRRAPALATETFGLGSSLLGGVPKGVGET